MKRILALFILWGSISSAFAQTLKYKGKINTIAEIDMELNTTDNSHFTGRYQYKGKTEWLNLSGTVTGETQSNLQLKEVDATEKETGAFDLVFDGETLNGTWTSVSNAKSLGVTMQLRDEEIEIIHQNKSFELADGYYYSKENELRVKSNGSHYDIAVWINSNSSCTGILLSGKVSSGSELGWRGKLVDEYGHGDANVIVRFDGNLAFVTISPLFKPGAGCLINVSPYERGRKREDAELD